ncbi:thioredoxin family protein [Bacillus thuringiensis]|uniref:thioredoxin family protein n=1 Tax=Bacillus cereus group TaxID=86661 RepID=UPI00330ACF84|nr:thioredoxin family protein [Bacillus cereus]MCU5348431.1 thioredoxin family protein [Bacillus cereus]MCU5606890.1 thioredoxin family protein [Bacillus cereus]MCU5759049.1 thioredoxin family protein [Bacillus cereus]HDR6390240.1 thioredoxin family protein [Bacillus cereus]
MKKMIIISIIVIITMILISLNYKQKEDQQTSENYYQNNISFDQLQSEISNKKEKVIYFYKPDCHYCENVSPIIIPMTKEMKINLETINLKENPKAWEEFKIQGTPTIIHFKDGKEVNRILGQHKKEKYIKWFEETKE